MLSEDISFFADGGDKIKAVKKICTGIPEVAELLTFVYHKFQVAQSVVVAEVNHQPALLYFEGSILKACQVFEILPGQDKIHRINSVLDPGKLRSIQHAGVKDTR